MADDWSDDPEAKVWMRDVLDSMAPKMEGSAFVISLVPSDEGDVKFWVELGASIMMDKPILAVALHNDPLPAKLLAVADEVVRIPQGLDPSASDAVAEAVKRMLGDDA